MVAERSGLLILQLFYIQFFAWKGSKFHHKLLIRLLIGPKRFFSPLSDWPKEFFSPLSDWPKKFSNLSQILDLLLKCS
jgi:hypothetical protein